ncbi:hypothetical protein ACO3TA_03190 [Methanocaldococcus sp. 28A]
MCAPIAITTGTGVPTLGLVLPQIIGMIVLGLVGIMAITSAKASEIAKAKSVSSN